MGSEDDAYGLRHLAGHLAKGSRIERFEALLVRFDFLSRKLAAWGVLELLGDFDHLPAGSPLREVQAALRLATEPLDNDPAELAGQLLGRLPAESSDPAIARLIAASRDATGDQYLLRPVSRSLSPIGLRQSLALTGAGRTLAVTSDDRVITSDGQRVLVWDLTGRQTLRSWIGHREVVTAIALTPDQGSIVSGDARGEIRVWHLESGRLSVGWIGHKGPIHDLVSLSDGRRVLSAGGDGSVKLWNLATGAELRRMERHTDEVMALAVAKDGQTAVSGSKDATICVWDLAAQDALQLLISVDQPVYCLAMSLDDRQLISGGIGDAVLVWDLASGTLVRQISGRGLRVHSVALSPDGRLVAVARGRVTVEELNGEGKRTLRGPGERLRKVAFCRDGEWLVTGGSGLEVWDLGTDSASDEPYDSAAALAITPDGQRAVVGSIDGTLSIWCVATGRKLHRFTGSLTGISALVLSPEGDQVFLGDFEGRVRRLALTGEELQTEVEDFESESSVRRIEWTGDGRYLLAYQDDLRVWDLAEGRVVAEHRIGSTVAQIPGTLRAVVFPDPRDAPYPYIFDLLDGRNIRRLRRLRSRREKVRCLVVAADGRFVVTGSEDGKIKIWNLGGRGVRTWEGHRGQSLALPADGRYVVSCSDDRTVRIWDPESGRCLARFTADNRLLACAVTPDGQTIVVCGFGGELHFLRWRG
ncbi:MAG TPA: hypothetical protein VGS22_11790 [Thermoanaerobaculia bacterium]|jgi:WD40 repeat protein|nr:hypothetical protein [Thermoanaerobaculia bacterium]